MPDELAMNARLRPSPLPCPAPWLGAAGGPILTVKTHHTIKTRADEDAQKQSRPSSIGAASFHDQSITTEP
jgi:hypothetical protein